MSVDPTASQPPVGPTAPQHAAGPVKPLQPSSSGADAAYAGFAKMLGPSATTEEVKKAMNQAVNFIIMQLKDEEKKARETAKHMKSVIEGKDDGQ